MRDYDEEAFKKEVQKWKNKRSRSWTWTWHYEAAEEADLIQFHDDIMELGPSYYCYGLEKTKAGKRHLQGYWYFDNAKRGSAIMKLFWKHQIWLAVSQGSSKENMDYCSKLEKEGEFFIEDGERPSQGRRQDLDDMCEMIEEGKPLYKVQQAYPKQTLYHFRGMEQLKKSYAITNYEPPKVHTLATVELALQYFKEEYGAEPREVYYDYNSLSPTPYHHERYGIMVGVLREDMVMLAYKSGLKHYSSNHLLFSFVDLVFIPQFKYK